MSVAANGVIAGAVFESEPAAHGDGTVTVSLSSVTAPSRASARPWIVTPAPTVIDVWARIEPRSSELAPSVAELPTCQKTLQAWAPPVSET